jgi:protein-L-isoaspartate(D-aspartate) O-methyltransferase
MSLSAADQANQEMVDRLIAEGALWSPRLIAAFRATPRHCFLDRIYQFQRKSGRWKEIPTAGAGPGELRLIYADRALITRLGRSTADGAETPISSSSQPSLMAQMLHDLQPAPGMRTLEVGAGTGYNAALLAHVCGPDRVATIDVDRAVLAEAWEHLQAFPERRVHVRYGDGRAGLPDAAPFDRLMVTAATPDLEPAWLAQSAEGGVVLAPVVFAPGLAYILRGRIQAGTCDGQLTRPAFFMPLRSEGETGSTDNGLSDAPDAIHSWPAPWAGWFDGRRPRATWLRFSQALGFYAWLRGLAVDYRTFAVAGGPGFGIRDRNGDGWCWMGPLEWRVNGAAGRQLGGALWQAFLAAGGPWPTDFRVRLHPDRSLAPAGAREEYVVQGPRCQQVWWLPDTWDRPACW